jgi:dienelactone hydrolase
MGFSNGATGALYAADGSGRPIALARADGVAFRAAMAFYPGCSAAHKAGLTPAIPLAVFIGADDDWTPPAPCEALVNAAKRQRKDAEIHMYAGSYHGFDVPGSKVRLRKDVRMANRPGLASGVHVGGNEAARQASIVDVDDFVARQLGSQKAAAPTAK